MSIVKVRKGPTISDDEVIAWLKLGVISGTNGLPWSCRSKVSLKIQKISTIESRLTLVIPSAIKRPPSNVSKQSEA